MMKKLPLSILAISASIAAIAQPVLQASDVAYAVGDSWTINVSDHLSAGPSGANQTWDFSGLNINATAVVDMLDPSTTTFGSQFPTATVAQYIAIQGSWAYVDATSSSTNYGIATTTTAIAYSDGEVMFNFPLNYMDTNDDSFAASFVSNGFTVNRSGSVNSIVDGYGTVITPSGTFTDVLRVKMEEDYQDAVVGSPQVATYETEIYHWYKAGIRYPVLINTIFNANGQVSESIQYTDYNVGINERSSVIVGVYPNPTSDVLNLSGTTFKQAQFEVLNAVGQVVLIGLVNDGKVDVSGLTAGIHILRVTQESGETGVSRFQVIR